MLPELINMTVTARVSFQRISSFLQLEELDSKAVEFDNKDTQGAFALEIENASFQWASADAQPSEAKAPTLNSINIKVPKGKLMAIVGSVGSGKTSLLSA